MNAVAIFAMQVVVSVTLIAFSVGMLASGKGDTAVYLPILSGVTATWLPNPSYPRMAGTGKGGQDVEMGMPAPVSHPF